MVKTLEAPQGSKSIFAPSALLVLNMAHLQALNKQPADVGYH